LRSGADDYVIKPFEPEELEARIAAVLNRIEQTRQEERRQIDSLRSRILAEVSSRLRLPVTSLMAHMNLILAERFGDDQVKQARYLHSAVEDANVLCELLNDLSWASSDTLGALPLKREPIRVAPVVRAAASNAARVAGEKSIHLDISCGGLLSANIDSAAMTKALAALLEAAVDLSPMQSQVHIGAVRAAEGGLEFMITDGGCAAGRDSEHGGDSLSSALSLARQVVKAHGGNINIAQEHGRQHIVIWVPGRVTKHVGKRL
jgi:signal transduction histidine kinase